MSHPLVHTVAAILTFCGRMVGTTEMHLVSGRPETDRTVGGAREQLEFGGVNGETPDSVCVGD